MKIAISNHTKKVKSLKYEQLIKKMLDANKLASNGKTKTNNTTQNNWLIRKQTSYFHYLKRKNRVKQENQILNFYKTYRDPSKTLYLTNQSDDDDLN